MNPYITRLHNELHIPVLYVTHSQQEVAQLADYLVLLADGKVQAAGLLSDTLSRLDLPQAQDKQASSVWHATLTEQDTAYHLSRVTFEDGELTIPVINAALGTKLRIQIYASDVSITLEVPKTTSILNVLPAIISNMIDDESGQTVVRLQVESQPLLARITRKSAHNLNLQTGMMVYVQIKSTSILN